MLLIGFVLAGCEAGDKRPALTLDVLTRAAEQCGAKDLQFAVSGETSTPPSFSYLDPGPMVAGKPTKVSSCLAEALKDHRFQTMTIRLEPVPSSNS